MISVRENFMIFLYMENIHQCYKNFQQKINHLCSSPFHSNIFRLKNINFFASPYHDFLNWRIYTSVQVLTKMGFSTLKNLFYPKNIHHCASALRFFSLKNSCLCASWLKWCFYTRIFFYLKNIHLCANGLNWCCLHINKPFFCSWSCDGVFYTQIFFPQRIYTYVRRFFYFFHLRISTFVQVDENSVSTLANVVYLNDIQLCASAFKKNIYLLCDLTETVLKNVFYLKNIHLCASIFQFLFLKNIYLCASLL